jgi:hypothetical protein
LACAAIVLLASCGGSSHEASTPSGGSAPPTGAPAGARTGGIQTRVLTSNELAGFTSGGVSVYTTAREWLSSPNDQQPRDLAAAEKAMLTHQGFRAGAIENLTGPPPDEGLSVVEQFRSVAAARAALAFYISQQEAPKVQRAEGSYASFRVSGIPGAVGYTLGGAGGGANISFTRGDYYLLVGRQGGSPSDLAGLSDAARHLYDRVGG